MPFWIVHSPLTKKNRHFPISFNLIRKIWMHKKLMTSLLWFESTRSIRKRPKMKFSYFSTKTSSYFFISFRFWVTSRNIEFRSPCISWALKIHIISWIWRKQLKNSIQSQLYHWEHIRDTHKPQLLSWFERRQTNCWTWSSVFCGLAYKHNSFRRTHVLFIWKLGGRVAHVNRIPPDRIYIPLHIPSEFAPHHDDNIWLLRWFIQFSVFSSKTQKAELIWNENELRNRTSIWKWTILLWHSQQSRLKRSHEWVIFITDEMSLF